MTSNLWRKLVAGVVCLLAHATVPAESWPPLNPPDPMPVDWVVKQVLTRFPEVHARHRGYLAALERIPLASGDKLRTRIAEYDAELSRLRAVEHHLMLQWRATHAFYDYVLATRAFALAEDHRRLVDAYATATMSRENRGPGAVPRDLALEAARLHADSLKLAHDRLDVSTRLNALMDHRLSARLPAPKLGETSPLPADRDVLIKLALKNGIPMRIADIEVKRSGIAMELARSKRLSDDSFVGLAHLDRSMPATTNEAARAQDQRRATGVETVRDVIILLDFARSRRDQLTIYEQTIRPRVEQMVRTALASYQAGRTDIYDVLDAYQRRYAVELEELRIRVEYEKSLADLARATGALPAYAVKKMSSPPLNVGGAGQ